MDFQIFLCSINLETNFYYLYEGYGFISFFMFSIFVCYVWLILKGLY